MRWAFKDGYLAFGLALVVMILIVPIPPAVLDTLFCVSLALCVMTLLKALLIEDLLEFSSFPSLLLFLTLFRLSLNIASTRMILSRGEAGRVIQTFGEYVAGGSILIGLVIFALLSVINFIVITKGAGRIAEVCARFTLDALPGKQAAIDSALSSGALSHEEAREESEKLARETDFHGAMDGASKFVRGDAIASIVITLVNIFGGLMVGMIVWGFAPAKSWQLFTLLTIGDGLVSAIPALLLSVAAAMICARSSRGSVVSNLLDESRSQPAIFTFSALLLCVLGLVPGMPLLVLWTIASLLFVCGRLLEKKQEPKVHSAKSIEVEVGLHLLRLADELVDRLPFMREQISSELGLQIPSIVIKDNTSLSPRSYVIKVKGVVVASGKSAGTEPLLDHLRATVLRHAYELLTRQDVHRMTRQVEAQDAAVVGELVPKKMELGQILKVMQGLLKEGVSISDHVTIFELLADHAPNDVEHLTEKVREGLARGISERYFGSKGVAHVITLDPQVEKMVEVSRKNLLRPATVDKMARKLLEITTQVGKQGVEPVVLTTADLRPKLRRLLEDRLPHLPVLSPEQVTDKIKMRKVGKITTEVLR